MKTLKRFTLVMVALSTLTLSMGCYGTFGLTRNIYSWNGKVTDSKFANSIIMWGLIIIPAYPIATFIDILILNVIEFWSGSNPMAMTEGESETQIVASADKVYEITATKNQFHVKQIEGVDKGREVDLVYHTDDASWYLTDGEENIKLAQGDMDNNAWVKVFHPDGKVEEIAIN